MRSEIGRMTLEKTFEEQDIVTQAVARIVNEAARAWSIECLRHEIQDIIPLASIKQAVEMQAEADRRKRDGTSDIWRQFKFTLLGYAGAVDSRLKQAAIESEVLTESAITNAALLPRVQRVSTQLFYMLVLLSESSAQRLLEHAGDGEGLLSWHRLVHFRGLFAAPSRCKIDVHRSKQHALFNADKC